MFLPLRIPKGRELGRRQNDDTLWESLDRLETRHTSTSSLIDVQAVRNWFFAVSEKEEKFWLLDGRP